MVGSAASPTAPATAVAAMATVLMISSAAVPFVMYLAFLFYHLGIDIVRSLFSLPAKLDRLTQLREAAKDEEANPNKVERWLHNLAAMAPDIVEVVVGCLTHPAAGVGTVIRKIAEKARAEAQAAGG